ncbi:MAG: hypothetical protein ACK45B_13395 [Limisphaerales bacterium]
MRRPAERDAAFPVRLFKAAASDTGGVVTNLTLISAPPGVLRLGGLHRDTTGKIGTGALPGTNELMHPTRPAISTTPSACRQAGSTVLVPQVWGRRAISPPVFFSAWATRGF